MTNIYSKVEKQKLIHIIHKKQEIVNTRQNIIPHDQFLQLSSLKLNKGTKFKPHYHIFKDGKSNVIAQAATTKRRYDELSSFALFFTSIELSTSCPAELQ